MTRRSREIVAGTAYFVGITVALGAGQGNRFGGDEFVKRSAMAVRGDVAVFRIGDLQKIHSNARQADGLRGSRTTICGRHPLQIEVIHDKEKGRTDQNADKKAHLRIMARPATHFKRTAQLVALGHNALYFRWETRPPC
jgi:hypothetical protein